MEPGNQRSNLDRQPSLIRGGRALLFEVLCANPGAAGDGNPRPGDKPFRNYELQALTASVIRELQALLNTRLPVAVGRSDESTQTILNYGLPDFSLLNAASPADRRTLATLMEAKISAFEPRLRQVRVTLEPDPSNRCNLIGSMTGILQVISLSEAVSFPIAFPLSMGSNGVVVQQSAYASG
jgi:type VI secretion system lysozyme-like protein